MQKKLRVKLHALLRGKNGEIGILRKEKINYRIKLCETKKLLKLEFLVKESKIKEKVVKQSCHIISFTTQAITTFPVSLRTEGKVRV